MNVFLHCSVALFEVKVGYGVNWAVTNGPGGRAVGRL